MSPADQEPQATAGFLDRSLREEFPGLALRWLVLARGSGRSNRALKARLHILSDRFAGPQAIQLRQRPIPWAYRVFFRHIGLDPDEQPTPVEAIALERLKKGGFASQNLLDDALTIAIMESGVALQAFDADRVVPPLGLRPSRSGEELDGRPGALPEGTLVIADSERPVGLLFGAMGSGRGVSKKTTRTALVSIQVSGVPDIAVEEALWLLVEALESGG
ncbi:MAG TPA: B3/4 domain-containing protein [Solirubrobacterales bacterium]|nr:B3/4 domain-containing protein [Solirubrobacterales bacterium]